MENKEKYDWLVIVFIHEIDQAGHLSRKLVDEIVSIGPGRNKVFLLRDFRTTFLTVQQDLVTIFHLELFELQINTDGNSYFLKEIAPAVSGINPKDRNGWKQAYQYILDQYHAKADRKMLLTWSHGAGFGINKEEDAITRKMRERFRKKHDLSSAGEPASITIVRNSGLQAEELPEWAKGLDIPVLAADNLEENADLKWRFITLSMPAVVCKNLEIVWIWELAEVLEAGLKGDKIDILLMMNCNMQLFDTGYMLRKSVRYLVAPETIMFWYGYAYDKLFLQLKNNPRIKTRTLLESIRQDYLCKYKNDPEASQYLNDTSLFINNLKYYDRLLGLLESSLGYLIPKITKSTFADFKYVRFDRIHAVTEIHGDNSYDLIDMGQWFREVKRKFSYSWRLRLTYWYYRYLISAIVYKKFIGSTYTTNDRDSPIKYGLSGISLFFPAQKPFSGLDNKWGDCAYYGDQIPNPFIAETTWDDFIKKYFEMEPDL